MKKYLPTLVAVCFSLLLTGCIFLERSVFSRPQAPDGKLSYSAESMVGRAQKTVISTSADTITVTHPELDITILARNRQTNLVLFGPALEIVLLPIFPWLPGLFTQWFESPPLQMVVTIIPKEEGFSFNSEHVTLETGCGKSLKPIDFVPEIMFVTRESSLVQNYIVEFNLKFDTSNRNFNLLLDGIEKNGKPFPIQKIQFKMVSDWMAYGL